MATRIADKVPDGTIIVQGFILTPPEVQFYQQLANDETVEDAAHSVLMSKRTCEDRMYRFQNPFGIPYPSGINCTFITKKDNKMRRNKAELLQELTPLVRSAGENSQGWYKIKGPCGHFH